jgi:hypothetical protein
MLPIYVEALGANGDTMMGNMSHLNIGFAANKDVKWGAISISHGFIGPQDSAYMGNIPL